MTTNNHSCDFPYKNHPLYHIFEMMYGAEVAQRLFEEEMGIQHKSTCNCKDGAEEKCTCRNETDSVKPNVNSLKGEMEKVKQQQNVEKNIKPHMHSCACNTGFTYGATNIEVGEDGHHHIYMMLPGFAKEDIEVSYKGKTLTVVASSKKKVADCNVTDVCNRKTVKEEYRSAETVKREFTLNNPVFEEAKISLENGILFIAIPAKKPEEAKKLSF